MSALSFGRSEKLATEHPISSAFSGLTLLSGEIKTPGWWCDKNQLIVEPIHARHAKDRRTYSLIIRQMPKRYTPLVPSYQ